MTGSPTARGIPSQQPARLVGLRMQPAGFRDIAAGGGNAAIGGAGAYCDHIAGSPRHFGDDLRHRGLATGQDVEAARAARPPECGAFETENIERLLPRADAAQKIAEADAARLAQGRVRQNLDAGQIEGGEQVRRLRPKERHAAAAATAGLQPKEGQLLTHWHYV